MPTVNSRMSIRAFRSSYFIHISRKNLILQYPHQQFTRLRTLTLFVVFANVTHCLLYHVPP